MTIISHDDICDGVPRIDGFGVTVIEVYHSHARKGLEPAEVADKLDVPVARVHEALAFYFDHIGMMREMEDLDELIPATADRDDWTETTPSDADESLFGDGPDGPDESD
jgi:uncharacterized protein (DUF433 family)